MLNNLDPFGGALDEPAVLSKQIHYHFETGHRVTINSPGHPANNHSGTVTNDRNDARIEVQLDSGHTIHCPESELIPEDFPSADQSAKVLQRAIDAGRVSIHDQIIIRSALAKIARGQYATDPFPLGDELPDYDSPFRMLKLYEQKYADGDVLAKRASASPFHIGQTIITKNGRRAGTVKAILSSGLLEVQFGASLSGLYTPDSVEQQAA